MNESDFQAFQFYLQQREQHWYNMVRSGMSEQGALEYAKNAILEEITEIVNKHQEARKNIVRQLQRNQNEQEVHT